MTAWRRMTCQQKGDYLPAHRLNVNVLLSNITLFVIFAVLNVSLVVNHSIFTFIVNNLKRTLIHLFIYLLFLTASHDV